MRQLKLQELQRDAPQNVRAKPKVPLILILENVRSLLNVGAIFRTSDAFSIQKIYLCGITGTPPHRDIQKTALGATETVEWEYVQDIAILLKELKSAGIKLGAIEQTDKSISLPHFMPEKICVYALVLGNEAEGVSAESLALVDFALEIPQFGAKHSLNVAVCAGVVGWHFLSFYLNEMQ